jgi:DNA-binding response OmpR family regulator
MENEHFLAESIFGRLQEIGFTVEMHHSTKNAMELDEKDFSVVVLSSNLHDEDSFFKVIKKYKRSTIIVMISYINNDFLVKAVEYGANDYILKPFVMDVLIRKIATFQRIQDLEDREKRYLKFMNRVFEHDVTSKLHYEDELPIFIYSKVERYLDSFAFYFAKSHNKMVEFISLKELKQLPQNHETAVIYYFRNFSELQQREKEELLEFGKKFDVIIGTTNDEREVDISGFKYINITSGVKFIDTGEILSVSDYIKQIIVHNQYRMPDTEISKHLGISRKSLWEKRRKLDIQKKRK